MREVYASVMSYEEVIRHTADAWYELGDNVFQAAWMVCGYFTADHFRGIAGSTVKPVETIKSAHEVLEPSGVLEGTTITATPQFCRTYEWRIQDKHPEHRTQHCHEFSGEKIMFVVV